MFLSLFFVLDHPGGLVAPIRQVGRKGRGGGGRERRLLCQGGGKKGLDNTQRRGATAALSFLHTLGARKLS
jgi:hypothetical protein